jgi:RteC protein
MVEKAIQLQVELEHSLEKIGGEAEPIKRCAASLNAIENSIKELFNYYSSSVFISTADEIHFFKVSAPCFLAKYLYLHKVLEVEIIRRNGTHDNLKRILKKELDAIDLFINCNGEFLANYYTGSTEQDDHTFTRLKNPDNWIRNDYSPDIPRNFSSPSFRIATLLANERIRSYIEKVGRDIEKLEIAPDGFSLTDYAWEGATKAAAWELLNKLAEKKIIYFRGEPADKKKVAEFARLALNLHFGNIYETDRKNRIRKKDQYPFLRSLLDDSISTGENSDIR